MKNFRLTLVATFVATALAANIAHALNIASLPNFDQSAVSTKLTFKAQIAQQRLAELPTRSGAKSIYDTNLGKATFLWAAENQRTPDLGLVLPEERNAYAASYYLNALIGFSTEENATNRANLAYVHDTKRGGVVAKYRQEVAGYEVFNREYNILMDREHNLVAGSGYFSNRIPAAKKIQLLASFGKAEDALLKAIEDVSGGETVASVEFTENKDKYKLFEATTTKGMQIIGTPRTKKVVFDNNGELIAAHYVEVNIAHFENKGSKAYSYVISADGKVLFRKNLKAQASEFTYRAFANQDGSPFQGPHGKVLPQLEPGIDPSEFVDMPLITVRNFNKISTDDPWLAEDATVTEGNNVIAYADVVPPAGYNDGDVIATVTSDMTFDYPLMADQSGNSLANRQAAAVNMFTFINYLHDWWYDHGFDEASGNAQQNNYGRGGEDGDPLLAEAQDYSGLNNANMMTPADGASPVMQQYLFNSKDAVNGTTHGTTITSHGSIGLLQSTQLSSFGTLQYSDIQGSLVRLENTVTETSATENDGCEAATNVDALAGNIAVIDRGACFFTSKVLNAQNAGAIAAIVVNNNDDGTAPPMGGSDAAVTIPNIGLNYEEGHAIYDLLEAGETVTAEMFSTYPLKDSSFDNGIIAHEWGHYIQNRLVGNSSGLFNFQGRALGEGWSDFHSMMVIVRPEDADIPGNEEWALPYATGTYVVDFYNGFRRAPYTTNMEINPLTFQHITSGAVPPGLPPTNGRSPHAAGEIWASVLWDIYAGLLNTYEFADAEARMADYLIASYKMTPVSPTFVEARDALLAVMYSNDQSDYTLAVDAFARRGLGFGAVAPDRNSRDNVGVTESYVTKLSTFTVANFDMNVNYDGVELGYCTNDDILDAGETGTVSFSVTNGGSEALSDVTAQIVVLSDHDVTIENDGLVTFDEIPLFGSAESGDITVTLNEAGTGDSLVLSVTFPEAAEGDETVEPADLFLSTIVNVDFTKTPLVGSEATADMETFALFEDFQENVMVGGDEAENTQMIDRANIGFFQSLNPSVNLGAQSMLLINNAFETDVAVETDMMQVGFGTDFTMSFWHFYALEQDWDGGVVEISINGGSWIDVTEAGGVLDVGYNTEALNENPSQALQNRPVFSGINGDLSTSAGNMETVRFGSVLNGQTVRFRFRLGSDGLESEFGWVIDNVSFTNITTPIFNEVVAGDSVASCDNVAPRLTLSTTEVSVSEGQSTSVTAMVTDRNADDVITYSWVQTGGTAAAMEGVDTATMTFSADVDSDTTLTFEVKVSDGMEFLSSTVTANVSDTPTVTAAPTSSSNSSGGGSMGLLTLLLAPLAWMRRRTKK